MACRVKELLVRADSRLLEREKLRVLELGTGCGIVSRFPWVI